MLHQPPFWRLTSKGVQFQQAFAFTTNCDFGHMRGLRQITYRGVKVGGLYAAKFKSRTVEGNFLEDREKRTYNCRCVSTFRRDTGK